MFPHLQSFTALLLLSQVSLHQSVGAGTQLTEWRLSHSVVHCISGSTEVLTLGSQCIKKPTPSCLIFVSSGGTPPRRANWCLDTQMEVCLFFSQVRMDTHVTVELKHTHCIFWHTVHSLSGGGKYCEPNYNIHTTCLTLPFSSCSLDRVCNHTSSLTSLPLSFSGSKSQKHVLRPESLEGTDEEDPVSALEWDPLSTDYLLG